MQPNGKVKLFLPLPEGYGSDSVVFHIGDDGVATELETTVNEDGTISTELEHFSIYAVCKISGEKASETDIEDNPSVSNVLPVRTIIVIAIFAIAIVVGAILFVIKKKKKTT